MKSTYRKRLLLAFLVMVVLCEEAVSSDLENSKLDGCMNGKEVSAVACVNELVSQCFNLYSSMSEVEQCLDENGFDMKNSALGDRAPPEISKADDFGKRINYGAEVDSITSLISKVEVLESGKRLFTLENLQVWRETGQSRFRVRQGDEVIISRGAFNSFKLKKQGFNRSIKVKRMD